MERNFGKYDVPPTLQILIDLQKALGEAEHFFFGFHFYLSLTNFRYFNTPSDVIVFGNNGADGIHYGFLTDYGSAAYLEETPIVCVCPMDFEQPTRIIAKNLRDFLRINSTDSGLFYNYFTNEERYLATKARWDEEAMQSPYQPSEQELSIRKYVANFLNKNIEMPIIDHPYRYLQNIKLNRQKEISIQTQDGLGVTTPLLPNETHVPFPIHKHAELDLSSLETYLTTAPTASRLALFRDIQFHYVLPNEPLLRPLVVETMGKMGLYDEANRLSEEY